MESSCGTARPTDSIYNLPCRASGGQHIEGNYDGDEEQGATGGITGKGRVGNNPVLVPTGQVIASNTHQGGLEHTSTLREELYRWRPLEGAPIRILAQPVETPDGPPEGEDTEVAVRELRTGSPEGPSGMRQELLHGWLRDATYEKDLDTRMWDKLVSFSKMTFREGRLPVALTWIMMVLLTKGRGEYTLIGLVEVI